MGLIYRTYGCKGASGRRKQHTFEVMIDSGEHPKFCPSCGAKIDTVEIVPGTHSIGGSDIVRGVDLTYRLVEESSAERAGLAGNPSLKVTNMKDHLREGDVAVSLPNNTVTQFMGDAASKGINYGWGGGGGMIAPATSKPLPVTPDDRGFTGPTHAALSAAQGEEGRVHLASRREMISAGQINKTRGTA